ncbi:sulfotransferase domain-containing protein [Maricaulis parjimensis]|uniref:sulfotransferase domain-containing protein n=1 Tax=Maricaulis parjimensis TaxID=144023 RepID=UPI00193A6E80|nr:sulfotransferase domain-containing protein [Maricaulis parjimensis]
MMNFHPLDSGLARKSNLARKGIAYALQAPRTLDRLMSPSLRFAQQPPVIVNSIPKSGTHLMMQMARALPRTRYFGSFLAQSPSTSLRLRKQGEIDFHIDRIVPGEVIGAHLHYSDATHAALSRINALNIFIYRDPRDVVVSSLFYLRDAVSWNAISKAIRGMGSDEERLIAIINGVEAAGFPGLAERLAPYTGWKSADGVFAVSFEEARTNPQAVASRLADAYQARSPQTLDPDQRDRVMNAVSGGKSHTFRQGKVGNWVEHFTPPVQAAFDAQAGRLLEELGYV